MMSILCDEIVYTKNIIIVFLACAKDSHVALLLWNLLVPHTSTAYMGLRPLPPPGVSSIGPQKTAFRLFICARQGIRTPDPLGVNEML